MALQTRTLNLRPRLAIAADHYLHHENVSPAQLCSSIAAHLRDPDFSNDLEPLVANPYVDDPQAAGRELIAWSDKHLMPLADSRRNSKAVDRDRQRWAKEGGWEEGKIRCVEYDLIDGDSPDARSGSAPARHAPSTRPWSQVTSRAPAGFKEPELYAEELRAFFRLYRAATTG